MKSLSDLGVAFPVVLLSDIPEHRQDERALSRAYLRGPCTLGKRYAAKEGLKFIDQSGKLYVIVRASIKEAGGPATQTAFNVALTWIRLGLRTVITELEVDYLTTVDLDAAGALIVPLAENGSVDCNSRDVPSARKADTIPSLISAIR
jgi:hypothetical protein